MSDRVLALLGILLLALSWTGAALLKLAAVHP